MSHRWLPPRPQRRRLLTIAVLASLHAARTNAAHAQATLSHTDDAIPIPGGWVRLSILNSWERYDSRFGASGAIRALGEELSTDSLGPRQLPRLAPIEGGLQTLTNNPSQRLTFGRLDVRSDARIVTTPIALEYGITRRLSFGVVVPVVQTRRSAQVRVNQRATGDTTKTSNVGILPQLSRAGWATLNAKFVADLSKAATALTGLLARCAQNSAAAECNPIRGKETAAAATARRATEFAGAVVAAYGITTQTAVVAPLAGSTLATTIESQRAALATQLATYVPGTTLGTLPTTTTEFSYIDLQGQVRAPGLLQSELGGGLDSIATTERIGIGDVELRARLLVIDHVQHDSLPLHGPQVRLGVGGIVRFATSRPDSATDLLDIGTGEGPGVEVRSALDVRAGRVGATVAARYATFSARTVTAPLVGYPVAGFPYPLFGEVSRKSGNVLGIDVTPRFFVGEWLAFEGMYGQEHTDAATFSGADASSCSACSVLANSIVPTPMTVQRVGLGVRYSTVDAFMRRRARYPVEVSYRHLETITGD
ncbi:MAG: hypothetical protein ACJ79A_09950, partial [Gemmatimonadaceae bacterium]